MTSLQSSYRNWVVMAGQDDENEEGVDDAVIAEAYDRVNELATQLAKETEDTRKGAKAQKLSSQPVQSALLNFLKEGARYALEGDGQHVGFLGAMKPYLNRLSGQQRFQQLRTHIQTLEADSLEEATQVKLARRLDRAQRAADSDDEGVSDNEDDQEAEGEEDGAVGSASDTTAVGAYVVFKQHLEENQPRSTAKSPRAKTQKKPMPRKALRDDFSDEEESGFRDEMEEDEGDEDEDEGEDESTTSGGRRRGKSRGSSSSSRSSTANRPSMLESVVEDDNEEPEPFSDDDESVVSNGSKVGDKRNKSYGSTSSKARKKARGGALVSPVPAADADSGVSDEDEMALPSNLKLKGRSFEMPASQDY